MFRESIKKYLLPLFILFLNSKCQKPIYCYTQKDCFNKTGIIYSITEELNAKKIKVAFFNKTNQDIHLNDTVRLFFFQDNILKEDTSNDNYVHKITIGYNNPKLLFQHIFDDVITIRADSEFLFFFDKAILNNAFKFYPKQQVQLFYKNDLQKKNRYKLYYGVLAGNYIQSY